MNITERNNSYCKENYGEVISKNEFDNFQIINNTFYNFQSTVKHSHSKHDICFVVNGEFIANSEGKKEMCSKGDLFIQPAYTEHYSTFASDVASCINISFDDEYFEKSNFENLFNSFGKIQSAQSSGIFNKIINEIVSQDDFTPIMIEGLILQLISDVARANNKMQSHSPKWLQIILEYLNYEYSSKYKLDDLARIANIHPAYLVNAFKRNMNQTIGEYLRDIRVKNACAKLNSNLSIAQIAFDCGFSDQSHLNRTFKKVTGTTPLAYKKVLNN